MIKDENNENPFTTLSRLCVDRTRSNEKIGILEHEIEVLQNQLSQKQTFLTEEKATSAFIERNIKKTAAKLSE